MTGIESAFDTAFVFAAAWTLVQFVWQGAIVGCFVYIALAVTRAQSPRIRYAIASTGLLLIATLPAVTFVSTLSGQGGQPAYGLAGTAAGETERLAVVWSNAGAAATIVTSPSDASPVVPISDTVAGEGVSSWLFVVFFVWVGGVLAMTLYFLAGWRYSSTLRAASRPVLKADWSARFLRLGRRFGVTSDPDFAVSRRVDVPSVVGWLRPVILVPASVLTGLAPAHVEFIVAHEIAHIRRCDHLVNVAQVVCETLLFYHPAVWWVSRQMRIERENCCDDLVVAVLGGRRSYARALARLEMQRRPSPAFALAADGGSLSERIRRLIDEKDRTADRGSRWAAGLLIAGLVGLTVLAAPGMSLLLTRVVPAPGVSPGVRAQLSVPPPPLPIAAPPPPIATPPPPPTAAAPPGPIRGTMDYESYFSGGGLAQTAVKLEKLIMRETNVNDLAAALRALENLPATASLPSWVRLAESHPNAVVRGTAVRRLQLFGDVFAVPTLEEVALHDQDQDNQHSALRALFVLPARQGVPSVLRIARAHRSAEVRTEALQWIARLDSRLADLTLERALFEDRDTAVQIAAMHLLGEQNDRTDLYLLYHVGEHHTNPAVRAEAERILRERRIPERTVRRRTPATGGPRLAPDQSGTANKLVALLFESADAAEQEQIVAMIARLDSRSAIPVLENVARVHPSAAVREMADTARIGKSAEEANNEHRYEMANVVVKSTDAEERARAMDVIERWDAPVVEGVLMEVAFLEDNSGSLQARAINSLKNRGTLGANWKLAQIRRSHQEWGTRLLAQLALRDVLPVNDAVDELNKILFTERNETVWLAGVRWALSLPDGAGREVLSKALVSEDVPASFRRAAADMLDSR